MNNGTLGNKLNGRAVAKALRSLRQTDNITNLIYLAVDYLTIIGVAALAIGWSLGRQSMNLSWVWDVPIILPSIVAMGALQHRLAGLAHEASHYTLLRNRFCNDLLADLFCMFPVFASIQQYRVAHLAHHQFTNDWERDPDLTEVGRPKGVHEFPISRRQFIFRYYVRFFLPWVMFPYIWKVAYQSVLGKGQNPYLRDPRFGKGRRFDSTGIRWASVGGFAYVISLATIMSMLRAGNHDLLLATIVVAAYAIGIVVISRLPDDSFFQSPMKHSYSSRFEAALRLTWMTLLLSTFPVIQRTTGVNLAPYFWLLWICPILTSFSYFMLLRDVYQHANADAGRLTNSRVFFTDPLTHWAVFVYGQDMHIPHHLFPMIPHYNLPDAHLALKSLSEEYRQQVVECEGTFRNTTGRLTILDVMETKPETREEVARTTDQSNQSRLAS